MREWESTQRAGRWCALRRTGTPDLWSLLITDEQMRTTYPATLDVVDLYGLKLYVDQELARVEAGRT